MEAAQRFYREAGIPLQTGTVCVGGTWAGLLSMVPAAAQSMSLPWWRLLAYLCFMRQNLRHFAPAGILPTWAETDFFVYFAAFSQARHRGQAQESWHQHKLKKHICHLRQDLPTFKLKSVACTIPFPMAASSSKMLLAARKASRTKKQTAKQVRTPSSPPCYFYCFYYFL